MDKRLRKLVAIALCALLVVVALSTYLLYQPLTWFDKSGALQAQLTEGQVGKRLGQWLNKQGYPTESRVFHVMDATCACNWRTQAHKQVVMRRVTANEGTNVTLSLAELPGLKDWLPATPAVILFDADGELIYLGPYADGAFCNTESSFIEPLIDHVSTRVSDMDAGWINTVARGCYCPTS